MKKNSFKSKIMLVLAVGTLALTACNNSKADAKINTTETQPKKEVTLGEAVDGVYTNEFFGLEMTYPTEWTVLDEDQKNIAMQDGQEYIDSKTDVKIDLNKLDSLNLFFVNNLTTGSNVIVIAEKAKSKLALDVKIYKEALIKQIESLNMGAELKDAEDFKTGDKTFKHLVTDVLMDGVKMKQHYYFTPFDDYMLAIIITETNPNDTEVLNNIVQSIKINK